MEIIVPTSDENREFENTVIPLHKNPLFDDWLVAVEEYRNQKDAAERAAEEKRTFQILELRNPI